MTGLTLAIVGAGPAGLASALYAARAGHKVTLFEQFDQPTPIGSGLMLQPTGLSVLADLGLLDNILALGNRIDRLYGENSNSGCVVLDVRYDALNSGRYGLAVHRAALFSVLYEAVLAAQIPIETSHDIIGFENGAGGAMLFDSLGKMLGPFDLVIDCSGARSKLRKFSGEPSAPRELKYGALWASLNYVDIGLDKHALVQRYERASVMIGVLPMGRVDKDAPEKAAFFWSLKPKDFEALEARGLAAWKASVLSHWPEVGPYLDQILSFDDFTCAKYGHHTMSQPYAERLAFVGDAAHSASPQLGQGANMALLDAKGLAHALRSSVSVADALKGYAKARRRHIRFFQAMSFMFTPFYQSDSVVLPLIRDRIVSPLSRMSLAQKFLASMVSGTSISPFAAIGFREVKWRERRDKNLHTLDQD